MPPEDGHMIGSTGLTILSLVAAVVLLAVSAFLSSSEIAILAVERGRIERLAETGDRRAWTLKRLREDPHQLIVTALVGSTVANVAIASLVTTSIAAPLDRGRTVLLATVGAGAAIVVAGELAPKAYGLGNAEPWALRVSKPVSIVQTALRPVVFLVELVTAGITRLTGGSLALEESIRPREDVGTILLPGVADDAHDGEPTPGTIAALDATRVTAAMTSIDDVAGVSLDGDLEEARRTCLERDDWWVTVFDEGRYDVVGVLDLRRIVAGEAADRDLEATLERPTYVDEDASLATALGRMRDAGDRVAVVLDDAGRALGVVTTEGIATGILGGLRDVDVGERIVRRPDGSTIVPGTATAAAIEAASGVTLPDAGRFETVADYLRGRFDHSPSSGEAITVAAFRLTALDVDGGRIRRVAIEPSSSTDGATGEDGGPDGDVERGEGGADSVDRF